MQNNKVFFSRGCEEKTIFEEDIDFFEDSTKCGNAYYNIENGNIEDELIWEDTIGEVIKCPFCNTLIEIKNSKDDRLCPYCFEKVFKV